MKTNSQILLNPRSYPRLGQVKLKSGEKRIVPMDEEFHCLLRAADLFPKIHLLFCGKQSALQNLGVV